MIKNEPIPQPFPALQRWRLRDVADTRLGHPFRGRIQPDDNGDVNVVQVRDTDISGNVRYDNLVKTTLKSKKPPDFLRNGDILFVAKGANFYSVLIDKVPERTVCSPHFFLIRLTPLGREGFMPEFISWQLNQRRAQRYFKVSAEGSLYLSIRRQVLEDVSIKYLTKSKQKSLMALQRCALEEKKHMLALIDNRQREIDAIADKMLTPVKF